VTLRILHQDEALVFVDKPSGLAVHRGWAPERDVAVRRLNQQLGKFVHPIHRLDRGASGVLLFALTAEAARWASEVFAQGRAVKRYLALVRGVPPERFVVDHPLPRDEDRRGERVPAVTAFQRLEVIGRYSLVAAEPRTGRLHQIRRHLRHLSCPILGDVNYGRGEHNRMCRSRYGMTRLFLHATSLALDRPDGQRLVVEAPLAPELAHALEVMRRDPPGAVI